MASIVDYIRKSKYESPGHYNAADRRKIEKETPEDFAGPKGTKSFPIKTAKDVQDAQRLAGHADNPSAVRKKIRSIAKKKGLPPPRGQEQPSE